MKRRKFLVTTGTALLGSTAVQSATREPAVALNFDLVGVENVQPSSVNSILIDFQNFELVPKYVDETAGKATVTITLDIEGYERKQTQSSVSLTNGETVNSSDLGSAIPIVQDNISSSQTALDGSIKIDITHPDVSDSYRQNFTITDDPIQDGLVGYWPLHEWSGRANDLSGNENHGTLSGPIQGVWGRGGLTSYSFEGRSDDYVDTTYSEILLEGTVSVWHRPKKYGGVFGTLHSGSENRQFRLTTAKNGDGTFNYKVLANNTDETNQFIASTDQSFSYDEWYHVVYKSEDGSGGFQIVVNGNQQTTSLDMGSKTDWFFGDSMESNDTIQIGNFSDGGGPHREAHGGEISDFRIYDRILSDSEIQQLYNLGTGDYTPRSLHDGSDSGAVSRYKFEDDVSDSWSSNDANNNTNSGFANGVRGKSKNFDSSSEYVSMSNFGFDSATDFTMSGWIKPTNDSDGSAIMGRYDGTDDILQFYHNAGNSRVDFQIGHAGGSQYILSSGQFIQPDNWYHIVGTYDSSSQRARIFVNGILQDENDSGIADFSASTDFWIGNGGGSQTSNYFQGNVDDIRFYNRTLNLEEVQQLYQWGTRGQDLRERTTTKNKNTLVGWWKLNETNGSTAYDSSGKGNDGTVNGATKGAMGPLGSTAYSFDGTNDNVDCGNVNLDSSSGGLTGSAWLKPNFDTTTNSDYQVVIRGKASTSNNWGMDYGADGANSWRMAWSSSTMSYTSSTNYQNEWMHFLVVEDGSQNAKIYINGDLKKTGQLGNGQTVIGDIPTSIGGKNGKDSINANISNVRIYDRALTPQEVSYLYEQKF